jgi:hypothetical protein
MNTFDKAITAALFAIALASAFIANASIQELNALNTAAGKGASTNFIAVK